MISVGPASGGHRPHGRTPEPDPIRQFWIAFTLAMLTAFGVAALVLAVVAAVLSFAG